MEKYIVLRRQRLSNGAGNALRSKKRDEYGQPELSCEVIPDHELKSLCDDEETVAVAPSIKTKLIMPMDSQSACPNQQWGIQAVKADASAFTGAGVKVAVLDSGIDVSHPAFLGMNIVEKDFSGSGNGDITGHGTHCAGTIFGRDVNQVRIGVARGIQDAYIGKIIDDNGSGTTDAMFSGLHWALKMQVNIISMSVGFDFPGMVSERVLEGWPVELATSAALESYRSNLKMLEAIMGMLKQYAPAAGAPLVFAAAGNESRRTQDEKFKIASSLPAASDEVISVAAAGKSGDLYSIADFSNTNVNLIAPGVEIVSAWPGGRLKTCSGTSMACPHAAGVAALWWESTMKTRTSGISKIVESKIFALAESEAFTGDRTERDYGHGLITAPNK